MQEYTEKVQVISYRAEDEPFDCTMEGCYQYARFLMGNEAFCDKHRKEAESWAETARREAAHWQKFGRLLEG